MSSAFLTCESSGQRIPWKTVLSCEYSEERKKILLEFFNKILLMFWNFNDLNKGFYWSLNNFLLILFSTNYLCNKEFMKGFRITITTSFLSAQGSQG